LDPQLYCVPTTGEGSLSILSRPAGGDALAEDIRDLADRRVTMVVSALTRVEEDEFDLTMEREEALRAGLQFVRVAIPDRGIPGPNSIDTATRTIGAELEHGGHVAVHCRAGIGRSCLIAAAVLVTGDIPRTRRGRPSAGPAVLRSLIRPSSGLGWRRSR